MSTDPCGTVTVEPPFDPGLVSIDCDFEDQTTTPGEPVDVPAVVTNGNDDSTANATVGVLEDGSTITTEPVTVSPGGSETVVFSIEFADPGDYDISVELLAVSSGATTT